MSFGSRIPLNFCVFRELGSIAQEIHRESAWATWKTSHSYISSWPCCKDSRASKVSNVSMFVRRTLLPQWRKQNLSGHATHSKRIHTTFQTNLSMFSPPLAWHVDRRHWKMKTIVRCHRVKRTLKCNLHTPLWFLFDFAVCELHDRECPMLSSFVFEKQCAEHEWTSIHYSCHLFDASQLVDTSLANLQIRTLSRACVFRKSLVNLMTVALLLRTSLRVHCRAACVKSWTS